MPVHSGWSPLGVHACLVRPPWRGRQGVWACWLWLLEPQHHAAWGGPRAGARRAPAMGNPRCSKIARTPRACFTYANTLRLPPHLTQANTSKSNVFLRSSAQSTRGVLSFFGSFLAAASSATLASPAPAAWGNVVRQRALQGVASSTGSNPVGDTETGAGSCWNLSGFRPRCFRLTSSARRGLASSSR
jgi:hypothetical protein